MSDLTGAASPDGVVIAPRRTHRMTPVITVVTNLWRLAIPAALVFIGNGVPNGVALLLLVPILLVSGGLAWLSWRRFTYSVRDGALVVESGVLNRTRREVPLGRIQQVDVRRDLVQRFFGLSALHVDTASSGSGAEVVLAALEEDEAIALHRLLLDHRHLPTAPSPPHPDAAPTPPSPGFPPAPPGPGSVPLPYRAPGFGLPPAPDALLLTRIGTKDLVVSALTGRGLGVGVATVIAVLSMLGETVGGDADVGEGLAALVVVGLFAGLGLLFVLGSAIVTTVLANNDFTLHRSGTDLHVRRGLLEQRQTTLALHRVQCVRVVENPLRRALGLCAVELRSAGSGAATGGNDQAGLDTAHLTIPILRTAELPALLDAVLPFDGPLPPLEPAPPIARLRRRNRVAIAVGPLLAIGLLVGVLAGSWWLLLGAAVAAVLGVGWAEAAFRALGSGLGDDVVVARSGAYLRVTSIVPMARLQSVAVERSLFQVRLGVGTLRLDVAGQGSAPAIVDVTRERLLAIRDAALFDDTTRADERRARERTRRAARLEVAEGVR